MLFQLENYTTHDILWHVCLYFQISTNTDIYQQRLLKFYHTDLRENPSTGFGADARLETDGQTRPPHFSV